MCKYCEFTYVNEENGEKSNENKSVVQIRDGHRVLEVFINRYDDGDGYTDNELILDDCVNLVDGLHTVNQKYIKIEYCPFCGEKL